ncbi:MAG: hypothetical protein IJO47_04765, partial [Clostridia bacterium]|nr:hypothetical protein [Clostridia bacterium]
VPSARGIHPCDCYYLIFSEKWLVLRYNKLFNAFELCCVCNEKEISFSPEKEIVYVLVVSDIWRLGAFYGAFSYVLSMLDAGHIISQLMLIGEKFGCSVSRCDSVYTEEYGKVFGIDISELIPVSIISIDIPGSLESTFTSPSEYQPHSRIVSYSNDVGRFSFLCDVLDRVKTCCKNKQNTFMPCGRPRLISDGAITNDLYRAFKERSSGQSSLGTFSLMPQLLISKVEQIARDIYATVESLGDDIISNIRIFVNDAAIEDGIPDKKNGIRLFSEIEPSEFIHDSHTMLNVASMSFIVITTFDCDRYLDKYGDLAIGRIYTDAGAIMHLVSLCLTEKGFFTRPLKNINEKYIEGLPFMEDNERVSYMLIAGCENTYSVKLPYSEI